MKIRPKPDAQRLLDALCKIRVGPFGERAFHVLEPTRPFYRSCASKALSYLLQRVADGEVKRAVVNMPPRSGKTRWTSVIFAAFLHGLDPTLRIVCVSYSSDLAAKHARDYRALITSDWYRQAFPGTRIDTSKNSKSEICLEGGGYRLATSIHGTLTGRGGDVIIIDDSMRAEDAYSDAKRQTPSSWFDGTLLSRLDNKAEGVILIVEQRLHEDDLTAHVLAKGGWEHLALPAIAEFDHDVRTGPAPEDLHHRNAGDVLEPERETRETLDCQRAAQGELLFAAQYQQNPIPLEGNIIRWEWFKPYDAIPTKGPGDQTIQSWDPASTPGEKNDFSVCITIERRGADHYIRHILRVRVDYPELKRLVISHRKAFAADIVLMENSSNGKALVQDIRTQPNTPNLIGITVKDDKRSRMSTCSAIIEAGHVFVPATAPWLEVFRAELLQFPGGRFDDQADALSQYLNWWRRRRRFHGAYSPQGGAPVGGVVILSGYTPAGSDYADETGPQFYVPKPSYDDPY